MSMMLVTGLLIAGAGAARHPAAAAPEVGPAALLLTAGDGAWSVIDRRIEYIGADFEPGVPIDLDAIGLGDPLRYAVDPHDNALWVTTSLRWLVRIDDTGLIEIMARLPARPLALAVDDRALWTLTEDELIQYRRDGGVVLRQPIDRAGADATIAVDSLRDEVAVASGRKVVIYGPGGEKPPGASCAAPKQTRRVVERIELDVPITAMALQPLTGDLWLLSARGVQRHARRTAAVHLVVAPDEDSDLRHLAYDAASDAMFVTSSARTIAFDRDGRWLAAAHSLASGAVLVPAPLRPPYPASLACAGTSVHASLKGRLRNRLPFSANIALAMAGAIGGTPGSPTPDGGCVDGTIWTSTCGISPIRIGG